MSNLDDLKARLNAPIAPARTSSGQTFLEGFFSSSLSSVGELFGRAPTLAAEEFRVNNPGAGLLSEFLTPVGVYGAAFKLSKLPKAAKQLDRLYKATGGIDRPVVSGAVREMARFAPLEAARLTTGAVIGDDFGAQLGNVAFGTAIAGVAGGIGGAFVAAGKRSDLARALQPPPGVDLRQRPTFQFRAGLETLDQLEPTMREKYNLWRNYIVKKIFEEKPAGKIGTQMEVGGRLKDKKVVGDTLFSTVYAGASGKTLRSRRLTEKDFGGTTELDAAFAEVGMDPEQLARIAVTPRIVEGVTVEGAQRLRNAIGKDMRWVAPGVYVAKAKDGLWQVARLIKGDSGALKAEKETRRIPTTTRDKNNWLRNTWSGDGDPVEIVREYEKLGRAIKRLEDGISKLVAKGSNPTIKGSPAEAMAQRAEAFRNQQTLLQPKYESVLELAKGAPQDKLVTIGKRRSLALAEKDKAAAGDKFLFYQTDDIVTAVPEYGGPRNLFVNQAVKMKDDPVVGPTGSITRDFAEGLSQVLAYQSQGNIVTESTIRGVANKLAKRMFGDLPTESNIVKGMADHLFEYIKPATFQESRNPIFARGMRLLRAMNEHAESFAQRFTSGTFVLGKNVGGWGAALGKGFTPTSFSKDIPSFMQVISRLDRSQLNEAIRTAYRGTPVEALDELVAGGQLSRPAADALKDLKKLDDFLVKEIDVTIKSLGLNEEEARAVFRPLQTYYSLPRMWFGDFRTKLLDEAGNVQALGSGRNVAASKANAEAIARAAEERGIKLTVGETGLAKESFLQTQKHVPPEMFDPTAALTGPYGIKVRDAVEAAARLPPKRFMSRGDLLDSAPDFMARTDGFTHEDVLKAVFGSVDRKMKYLAYNTVRHKMLDEWSDLRRFDPKGFEVFMRRADDMIGVPGKLTQIINDTTDAVLAPIIGQRSASKLAGMSNSILYWFTLGLMNPTFAALNVITPIQTVLPWLSYIQRAPDGELAKIIGWTPVMDQRRAMGQLGYIHPLKLMYQSFRLMGKPDEELRALYGRAANDRVLTSQITAELIGAHASVPGRLRESFNKKDFVGLLESIFKFLPERSESIARTFAFTANVELGRRVLRLEGEQLFQFAKRSTETTMINYATVDRARIITGPVGSMFGLFKNWQMHYIGMMARYAGVAINENHWGPLMWMSASTVATAGLGGVPLAKLANGLASWHNNSTGWEAARQMFNSDTIGDGIWYGLPGLLGVSLQASAEMPGTDINKDISMMFGSVHLDRARALGMALGNSWNHWAQTGESPFRNENVRDQVAKALTPRFMFRAMAGLEGEYIKSMQTGYPLIREVTPWQRTMYALGLNPTSVDGQFAIADRLWKDEKAMRKAVASYGAGIAQAQKSGDYERAMRLYMRAQMQGIPMDRVANSAATRFRRETEDTIFSRFSKDTKQRLGFEENY